MFSVSKAVVTLVFLLAASAAFAAAPELRVCADPNNMPFSNARGQGFENKLAELVAREMGTRVVYTWQAQRSRFFRKTLNAGICDVVMSVPAKFDEAWPTIPYYSSSYVFISLRDRHLRINSFDDPRLRKLRVGVHIVSDDNLPPAQALISRGMVRNVVGYSIFGHIFQDNPSAELINGVLQKDIDMAVAWGPLAGYFAKVAPVALDVTPVCAGRADAGVPFQFSIAMGVRRGDVALRNKLNRIIARRGKEIRSLLRSYGVPLTGSQAQACHSKVME
jgi:quinoprotein dehydrogenase-associated probable ABC transporter substrate-binding protein